MTPYFLQESLKKEIDHILENVKLKDINEGYVKIKTYNQFLPIGKTDEEHFPYVLIRFKDGEDDTSLGNCRLDIIIGIYDKNTEHKGYKDVLNIIEKIRQRFLKDRVLDNKYTCKFPMRYAVNEEDAYPFYFGGIETEFEIPRPLLETGEDLI